MVNFLAPMALFGAVLLIVPILVHLFRPRRVRQTPFSSLRWLHLTQQRLARHIKWHQIFLFLLRAAFVTCLVLALAKPMFRRQGDASFVERLIVLDVSRSMGYKAEGELSPLEKGKDLAANLISRSLAGDRTAVLLTGSSTQVLAPLMRDPETMLPTLRAVEAGATHTDLSSALEVLRRFVEQRRPDAKVEIDFITDNHPQSWSQGAIATFAKDLPENVATRILDVGVLRARNGWIADAQLLEARPADARSKENQGGDRRLLRVQVRSTGDAGSGRSLRIDGPAGLPEIVRAVEIPATGTADVDIEIPTTIELRGQVARLRLEPPDGLPGDDQFFLNLGAVGALRVLLLESDSIPVQTLRPGFHLKTAVDALSQATRDAFVLTTKVPSTVTPKDLAAADVVLLADVADLSDANLSALQDRVQAGCGLAIFLGPNVQPAFYNTKLYQPLNPGKGLIPVSLKKFEEVEPSQGGLAPFENVRWNHPLLAGLLDPMLGDLSQTRVHAFYRFDGAPSENDQVLAWVDTSTPAIIERTLGAGKVLLFNTTGNDLWSDLPRRKSFVPLVDRLLSHLSGGGIRHTFEVGESVALAIPETQPGESVSILAPDGKPVHVEMRHANGRTLVSAGTAAEPGIYQLQRTGSSLSGFPFVVQISRADSLLTPLDPGLLKKWWEPADFAVLGAGGTGGAELAVQDRLALWPWLVAAGAMLLLAEMFFVHWLCPRVNPPVVATMIVRRRELESLGNSAAEGAAALRVHNNPVAQHGSHAQRGAS